MGLFDQDFLEFIEALNQNKVEYLLVGGHAVNAHGRKRATGDFDILISTTPENAALLYKAIDQFGFDSKPIHDHLNSTKKTFEEFILQQNIKLPSASDKIEIMGRISGIKSFDEAFSQKKEIVYEGVKLNVISLNHLIDNKIATGRGKDFGDVKALQEKQDEDKRRRRRPKL